MNLDEADLRARRSHKWSAHPPDVLPAFVAELDVPVAPEISAALAAAVSRHDFGYAPRPAATNIRELVSQWMNDQWATAVLPAHVDLVSDVVTGADMVLNALCEPGSEVVICPPLYAPLRVMSRISGRVPVEVPLLRTGSRWSVDLERIEGALNAGARVVLLCQPHNPTGAVFTDAEMAALGAMVRRHGAWLVSDEIHAPLIYDRRPFVSALSSRCAPERTVVVTSTSKTWNTAGLKCAVTVAGSDELAQRIAVHSNRNRAGIGILGVIAMETALQHGEPWRLALMQHLELRRNQFFDDMRVFLPAATWSVPEASYLAWINLETYGFGAPVGGKISGTTPAEWLLEHGRLAVSPGGDFGDAFRHTHVRVNFGTSETLTAEIVQRMKIALQDRANEG
jgi:cysteine-S-conjugate beta-lyase